jgi:hypothetical protein
METFSFLGLQLGIFVFKVLGGDRISALGLLFRRLRWSLLPMLISLMAFEMSFVKLWSSYLSLEAESPRSLDAEDLLPLWSLDYEMSIVALFTFLSVILEIFFK